MDNYDETYLDIDELAKKIEMRIKELEKNQSREERLEYANRKKQKPIMELDEIIKEIDDRILEIEQRTQNDSEVDIEYLTDKINKKLEKIEDNNEEKKQEEDLSNIATSINDAMREFDLKRKIRKQQKAKYCDLARKRNNALKNKYNKK